ncbi:aspartate aminotransferase family protein [candidate division WOR-3 bacterium]|nr:aspartate aminotransferase family protein [candidate division WOR-3 bacterium]
MSGYIIPLIPKKVPTVKTQFRQIKTEIPVPESTSIFRDLEKYESRSMHGQLPVVWDRAEDFQVFDKYGNCWIDFTSTIFLTNSGHANPIITSALQEKINQKLLHTYTFAHEGRAQFLKKLIEITPNFCEKAFLLSAGTEATECAVKLMRMHGQTIRSSKIGIISFHGSMHGRTMCAEMLRGDPDSSAWIGYKDPNIYHLPFPYPWLVDESIGDSYDWGEHFQRDIEMLRKNRANFDDICGFMIESYQGWGAIFYPKAYIQALAAFAREHEILLTFDEIQGGFGRSGRLFVYQHYDVEPDLICIGKALSGGLPLSAVVGRREIMDLPEFGSMSSTHSGNPLCCTAALANLNAIEAMNLIAESERKGKILHHNLNKLKDKFPDRISFILGKGLLAGIIITNPETREPDGLFASKVCERAMQKGLLVVHTGREAIKIGPPLTIPDEALIEGIVVLDESFQEVINEEGEK